MAKRPPQILYHYCSVPTFFNIIQNKSIWLSDISKSNDSLELKWIKGQCNIHILKAWIDYIKAAKDYDENKSIDYQKFEQIQDLCRDLTKYETEKCWVFSLSEKQDDLGHWRGYADDGSGISIGFKTSFFRKIAKNGKTKNPADPIDIAFDYISYKEKEIEELFSHASGLSTITPQMNSDEVIQVLTRAISYSLLLSPFYKNPKFAEEKEWRLVFSMMKKELMTGNSPKHEFGIMFPENEIQYDFVIRNNKLVSHIAFIDDKLASNISEIWIGPKCCLSSEDIKLFLISVGYLYDYNDKSILIHKSQATYR